MIPLGLLSPGENGEIVEIRLSTNHGTGSCCCEPTVDELGTVPAVKPDEHQCCKDTLKSEVRVEDMGLRIGKNVEILNNGGGPVLVRVDESRIAVARGIAMKIMVRRAA
ncbi:MAG: FeoA family protein [Geobacteraceae bacterium]|nr:FeoA family protein [Geobacteraceae bacterium]